MTTTRVDDSDASAPGERDESSARPPYRLRDLRGRDRQLAVGMLVLLAVPFVVALVRAYHDGWIPSGDEANIATRALDVFSRHPPLTGLPSTSALYGDQIATNHPGPIEFYLLAVPLRALGMTAGPLLTAAAINGACVLLAAWVFFRRLGLTAMLWAGVLLLAVTASGGTAVLTDTLSSNMTMYSLLGFAVLVWAVLDGDLAMLPLAALVGSYAAQQHLAAGLIVATVSAFAVVVLIVQAVRRRRRGEAGPASTLRWWLIALGITVVCWIPVLIDQFTGHPGNLTAVVRFARDSTRPKLGYKVGFYQVVHAISPPTVLGGTNATGTTLSSAPGALAIICTLVVVAALVVVAWRERRRSAAVSRLAIVALVFLAAGLVNGSNVPRGVLAVVDGTGKRSFESDRINLYRWTWTAALLAWSVLGLALAQFAVRAARRSPRARSDSGLGPVALVAVGALIAASIVVVNGSDDHNRERPDFVVERRVATQVLKSIDRHQPIVVVGIGQDANLSLAPALVFRLVNAGVKVEVQNYLTPAYGTSRRAQPGVPWVVISSGKAALPAGPGTLLLERPFGPKNSARYRKLARERSALLDRLSKAAFGSNVVLAPDGSARINREYPGLDAIVIKSVLLNMGAQPRTAFGNQAVLKLISEGVLTSPAVDRATVKRVLDLPASGHNGTWGDEQAQVHLLTPAQVAACGPNPCFSGF